MIATGPTVAAARATQESLWQFLLQMPSTQEAQQLYALLIFGALGMFAHYFVKWAQGEITGGLFDYLFHQSPRRTVLSLIALVGASLTAVMSPVLAPDGQFIGWGAVLWIAVTTGYGIDSAVNKGQRREWSEDERTTREAIKTLSEPPAGGAP